jgi:prepilin-type processing-associated H-X9-DG protein
MSSSNIPEESKAEQPRSSKQTGQQANNTPEGRRSLLIILVAVMFLLIFAVLLGPLPYHIWNQWGRENDLRALCKSQIRRIGLACEMYAEDNENAFPTNWQQLYPDYIDNLGVFLCPSSVNDLRGKEILTAENNSYVLVPGLSSDMPARLILAYDKADNHQGAGRNVLFLDAHVEWMPNADGTADNNSFDGLLKAQAISIKKWRATGGKSGELRKFLKVEIGEKKRETR